MPTDIKFTGQRLDSTGLYYFNARYYDPNIGRFISADTIVPGVFNPQSLNRYSYCLNNPLRMIDPTGHEAEGLDPEPPEPETPPPPPPPIDLLGSYKCDNVELPGWSIVMGIQMGGKGFAENMQAQNSSLSADVLAALGLNVDLSMIDKCPRPEDWTFGVTSCRTILIQIGNFIRSEAVFEVEWGTPAGAAVVGKDGLPVGCYLGPNHTHHEKLPDGIYIWEFASDKGWIVNHESYHSFQWNTIANFEYMYDHDKGFASWAECSASDYADSFRY